MKVKDIICVYCKKRPQKQVDSEKPTWFGRYKGDELVAAVCSDCLEDNRDKWRKGEY